MIVDESVGHTYLRQRGLELLVVVLIIALLAFMAIQAYLPLITRARATHATGDAFMRAKYEMQRHYAFQGEWPQKQVTADASSHVEAVEGAITVHFKDDWAGQRITFRPAVPVGNLLGPVHWVAGPVAVVGYQVSGLDRSNVAPAVILPAWR